MSIKTNLIGKQYVKGNIKNFLQTYNLFYYPPEENFPTSKVRLSLFGEENGQPRMIRSLYFENIENHKNFILNNIIYNLYWLEKKSENYIPQVLEIGTFRMRLLDSLLSDIRKKVMDRWKVQFNGNH